jgi:hypothetical protein
MFIGLSGLLTCLLVAIATGDLRTRTIVGAGAVCGLAAFTKGFGLTYPLWVAVALVVGQRAGAPGVRPRRVRPVVLGALAAFVAGGWWWLRNVVRFGSIAPSVELSHRLAAVDGFEPDWGRWLREAVLGTGKRFWGNFGWYDTWIPYSVMVVCWAAVALAVVVAFLRAPRRALVAVLLAPFALLAAFLALNAARLYARSGVFALLQGRYLFGALVGLAAIVAIACGDGRGRVAAWCLVLAAAAMQGLALRAVLQYYWDGADTIARLRSLFAWCPWPAPVVALWAAMAMAAGGTLVVALVRPVRSAA